MLDEILKQDPNGRVACATFVTTGLVLISGKITTSAVDIEQLVRNKVREISYDNSSYGFEGSTCTVISSLIKQLPDTAIGVDNANEMK